MRATGTEGEDGKTDLVMADVAAAGPRGAVSTDDVPLRFHVVWEMSEDICYSPWSKNATWRRGMNEKTALQL